MGTKAPDSAVLTLHGRKISMAKVLAGKPTVVIFFRGGWCPFCNRQLADLADRELKLRELGYQIVGISADPPEKLAPVLKADHIRYRLFSDRDAQFSAAYGLAYRISPDVGSDYRDNGIELTPAPDGNGFWLPVPAAYIIDRTGTIRFVYMNRDPSIRIKPDALLAAAKRAAG
ncbi:MAG TPA: peroxiredoxin-like family protein [Opitutaceae bacterium]|nr:peroxiredoxin-like family protein [Opitutaceae bacterium]